MADQTIPLDEINRLRVSLGLKVIEERPSNVEKEAISTLSKVSNANKSQTKKCTTVEEPKSNEPAADRISNIRKRLHNLKTELKRKPLLENYDDDTDWLASVGKRKDTKILKEVSDKSLATEADNGMLKMSSNPSSLKNDKQMILTLKETSLNSEDEDVLLDQDAINDDQQARSIKLKQMNQQRKQKKLDINLQLDEEDDQQNTRPHFVIQNGEIVKEVAQENCETSVKGKETGEQIGKIRISLSSSSESDEVATDYVPVKIKKRKIKTSKSMNGKRIKQTTELKKVDLLDEDALEEEGNEIESFLNSNRSKKLQNDSRKKTAEDIAADILQEEKERQQRALEVNKIQDNREMVVDETSTFLDNLQKDIIPQRSEDPAFEKLTLRPPNDKARTTASMYSSDEVEESEDQNEEPDFHTGLASTLSFLKDRNIIPKTPKANKKIAGTKDDEMLKLKQKLETRRIEDEIEKEMQRSNVRYSKEEIDRINSYKEKEIAKRTAAIQHERLAGYNPEIKLTYKDAEGNQLTTKEAYKKLSQAFHGTKPNAKKERKAYQKITARNRKLSHDPYSSM